MRGWKPRPTRKAARRSRACAYPADDDHGPLALQKILLAGCPTVGVRTGASFVRCAETDDDVRALAGYLEAIELAQAMDRHSVRNRATSQFDSDRVVEEIVLALNTACLAGSVEGTVSV